MTGKRSSIHQLKLIPLEAFLSRLGYLPNRRGEHQLWYLSPLRKETKPSFKVNLARNVWYDFGLGVGGDVIDFVKHLENIPTVSAAIRRIREIVDGAPEVSRSGSVRPEKQPVTKTAALLTIESIGPVRSRALIQYLKSRGIDAQGVSELVQEAHYCIGSRRYFALAFENRSNVYELRNPYFQGTLGIKDLSVLPGDDRTIEVYEGWHDDYLANQQQRWHRQINSGCASGGVAL